MLKTNALFCTVLKIKYISEKLNMACNVLKHNITIFENEIQHVENEIQHWNPTVSNCVLQYVKLFFGRQK
jgi:hypothetical protein